MVYLKTQFLPRCKHFPCICETNQLIFCRENFAVCFEIHTREDVEFLNVRPDVTYTRP